MSMSFKKKKPSMSAVIQNEAVEHSNEASSIVTADTSIGESDRLAVRTEITDDSKKSSIIAKEDQSEHMAAKKAAKEEKKQLKRLVLRAKSQLPRRRRQKKRPV